jgi:hypothetical protein
MSSTGDDTKNQTEGQDQLTEEERADRDRRMRPRFRALIDEMLDQIRRVSREQEWSAEARLQAEADLERIMSQVRREATVRRRD